ncbi:MAG: multidrug effflux MFS transporter [Flavobacteriales bacterium]
MNQNKISIPLLALMMSFVAFSIDAVLPALGIIGKDLLVTDPNENQQIITSIFFGLAIGQLIYGPISDSIGRKPTIYVGFVFFLIGSFLCILAKDMTLMNIGRVLQGFGLSANRIVCIALIRDVFKGDEMAKVMSFIMTIFIIVPTLAPFIGQGILFFGDWKLIFYCLLIFTSLVTVWFAVKQKETLTVEQRQPFSISRISKVVVAIFKNEKSLNYTIVAGLIFSAFMTYLNMSQQIFQDLYGKTETFPMYFAIIAISIGLASFLNGRLVKRFGMYKIIKTALVAIITISGGFVLYIQHFGNPNFIVFILLLIPMMFSVGFLFGNLNAIAMEPLGKVAGIGASVIGSLSTMISVPISAYLGQLYEGNVMPLIAGFLVLSVAAISIVFWTEYKTNKVLPS